VTIVARTAKAVTDLFSVHVQAAAASSGVIKRLRKFDASSLLRTMVLGFLQKPNASDEHLAQVAAQCGVSVTPQAIARRHTQKLVDFLETIFRKAVQTVIGADRALAPILERFTEVTLLDSSGIPLPDSLSKLFPGCGGTHGGGKAALKLQTELDLRSSALTHVSIEAGRTSDGGSERQQAKRPVGSLRIADLGYFSVGVFVSLVAAGSHFLSRLHFKTGVRLSGQDKTVDLLAWLAQQPGPWIDVAIQLGPERLACRMIAWKLPEDRAAERRRKLRQTIKQRSGNEPSALRLAWCDWTILVTSVPAELLTPTESAVLYRARWQIELLFKRWKSQNLIATRSGSSEIRQMVRIWARLLVSIIQHWFIVTATNGDPDRSWNKVAEAIRAFVCRFAAAGLCIHEWEKILHDLQRVVATTCKRNPRTKPGTAELLNDPSRLEFRLS